MSSHLANVLQRIHQYLELRALEAHGELAWGWDGLVIESGRNTAIKGFKFIEHYQRERDVYHDSPSTGFTPFKGLPFQKWQISMIT